MTDPVMFRLGKRFRKRTEAEPAQSSDSMRAKAGLLFHRTTGYVPTSAEVDTVMQMAGYMESKKLEGDRTLRWRSECGVEFDVPLEIERLVWDGEANDLSRYSHNCPSFGFNEDRTNGSGTSYAYIVVEHPEQGRRHGQQHRFVVESEDHDGCFVKDYVGDGYDGAIEAYRRAVRRIWP